VDSSEEIFGKLLILVITAIIAAVVSHLLVRACRRGMERTGKPTTSLPFNIIRGVVWFLAALIVLKPVFGIDPTAFVAALGVTSIIISFGMQTTISNLVGGIELITSRTLEVGDVVDVNGTRGVVTDITWRNTLVREFTGNVEIIPNSQLDSATIVRLSPQMANLVTFTLMATSDADPAQVSAEVMAAIRAAAASELAEGYEPSVVCRGSGDCGGLAFQASLHLADPTHEYAVVDAIMDELGGRQWLLGASR
jgi:small-conductance mechanosensitive channel